MSYAYMPYLTLWDEISQNLAHQVAKSCKVFTNLTKFSDYLTTHFYEEINISVHHTLLFITSFIHWNKGFWLFQGSFSDFCKNLTEFYQIYLENCLVSQISVHSLRNTVFKNISMIPNYCCRTKWTASSEFGIRAVSPEPSLLAHTSIESRRTFRQKARSLAPLNGWACAVKIYHDGMLEDTNSLDGAHIYFNAIMPWKISNKFTLQIQRHLMVMALTPQLPETQSLIG